MAALAAVTRVPRDRSSSFFKTLAMAALEAGRIDDARAAAARATGTARTDAEYAQAEALMREAESAHADREVRGRLTNVMCGNGPVVLEVTTDTAVLRLVIDNPRDVVAPEGAGTVDMNCGEQNRPVRVAYAPLVDAAHNTVGAVKLIEFLR
jgi:hypothetical protein